MKRAGRNLLLLMFVGAVLVALVIAAALVWGLPHDQVTLTIDGERIDLPPLGPGTACRQRRLLLVLAMLVLVCRLRLLSGWRCRWGCSRWRSSRPPCSPPRRCRRCSCCRAGWCWRLARPAPARGLPPPHLDSGR